MFGTAGPVLRNQQGEGPLWIKDWNVVAILSEAGFTINGFYLSNHVE